MIEGQRIDLLSAANCLYSLLTINGFKECITSKAYRQPDLQYPFILPFI